MIWKPSKATSKMSKVNENGKRAHEVSPGKNQTITTPKAARIEKLQSPTVKTNLVKIEILTKNGNKIKEDLPIKTLIELWNSLETDKEIDGCSSHRKGGGIIRAHFFLKQSISLGEIHPEPEFTFERTTPLVTDSFQCKIVGLNEIRPPRSGETITVCVTRTHFGVPLGVIEQWLSKFGEIVTKPRYY